MKNLDRRTQSWGFMIALLAGAAPANAATLFLSAAAARLDESAKICISLEDGHDQIAGLQTNLRWDDTCMTPTDAKRLCKVNAATGKNVQSALQGRGTLKAILISFSDVNPIPDGQLFCCEFMAVGNEGTRCPAVQMEDIIGSTSTGTRISDIRPGNTGVFTILGGHDGAAPVVYPTQVTSGAQQSAGGDGCMIAAERQSRSGALILASFAVLFGLCRRRLEH